MRVYLSALGIACTLGKGKQEVSHALFQRRFTPSWSEWPLLSNKTVPVGTAPFELPDLPAEMQPLNSRNNRLLKIVLDEIKPAVDAAIAKYGASRIGVILATSTSGMYEEERAFIHKHRTGAELDGYDDLQSEISSPSLFASQYLGLQGPSYTISTACSSAGKAICSAKRLITAGICDAVITGGVDTLCDLTLNGFDSLELLSQQICNPFSKNRDGITIGEGAAVFLATSSGEIELCGCGESSDAHHICCPEPSGSGAETAIQNALKMAGLKPEEICYINLHGTGTSLNDSMESIVIHRIFGHKLPCSSTKALTGHALGTSGALEAAFLWLSLAKEEGGKIPLPPHAWDGQAEISQPPIHLSNYGETVHPINGVYSLMSNSFAFGGSNVCLILKKQSAADLVPHDPPMVLIDRVISHTEDFIHCQTIIKADSPFLHDGAVPSYVAMEYMAQTIAAWNGLMAQQQGEDPKIGYLLGARRLDINIPSFKVGDVLDIYGKAQFIDNGMAAFDCWVDIHGQRAVQAGMNVYQPGDAHGK